MRTPTSWWDKALLEEDPFASIFLVRKFSRGRRNDNWIKELVQDIQGNPVQLASATQWIAYAFAPEGNPTQAAGRLPGPKKVRGLLEFVEVFVRFYWSWYNIDDRAALATVNQQRKLRGFGTLLVPPKLNVENGGPGSNNAAATEYSPAAEPVQTSACRSTLAPQGPPALEDEPIVSRRVRDVAQVDVGTSSSQGQNDVARMIELRTSHDVATETSEATAPTEDSEAMALTTDEDCLTQSAPAPELSLAPSAPCESQQPIAQPPLSANGGTSDVVRTEMSPPPARPSYHGKKKARTERPAEKLRQRIPRKATNIERLSSLAKGEFAYHEKLKRGHLDDMDFEHPAETEKVHTQDETVSHRKKKPKKSKASSLVPESSGPATSLSASTVATASVGPGNVVTHISATIEGGMDISGEEPLRGNLPKRSKKSKTPTARKKLVAPDDISRPSKRQRTLEDGPDAFNALITAMRHSRSSAQEGAQDMSRATSAPAGINSAPPVLNERKRCRSAPGVATESDMHPEISRKVAKLPKKRSLRKRLTDTAPPVPPAEVLGIPANLEEEDRIIRDIATEALLDMHSQPRTTDEWADDTGAQDDPPSSDDEEDVPLSVALTQKGHVTSAPRNAPSPSGEVPLSATLAPKYSGPTHMRTSETAASLSSIRLAPFDHDAPASAPPFAIRDDLHLGPGCMPFPEDYNPSPSLVGPASFNHNPLPFAACDALPSAMLPRPTPASDPKPAPPPLLAKKRLAAQPIIWAESRQEVCESFDWFRSYQGGVYFNNDMVKGYLLSAFSSSRDIFARDGRLIISHGGGKAESTYSKNGQAGVKEADDQREEDKSVRALLRTYQMGRPLVLIIDDRYALFPYDLAEKGYTYVVLGFYHIAHAWAERQASGNGKGYVVRYKFAFEWCQKQPEPWWLRSPTGEVPPDKTFLPAGTFMCPTCMKESPLVYEEAWMCLQPHCPAFWTLIDGTRPSENLTYIERFLISSFRCNHETLEDIAPLPPAIGAADGVITSRRFCKGWHCKTCGRLSCRYKWEHWECKSCGTTLQVSGKTRVPNEFWGQTNPDFMHHKLSADSGIIVSQMRMYRTGNGFSHYHVYTLPHNRGHIYLILGRKIVNQTADEIFQEYQEQAGSGELRFRRWPLRSHQCRGTLLTNYFSQNTGEPYQYVGGTANTVPFEGAPSAVVKARDLIHARMTSVIQAERQPYHFNEVLSAAYMEKQKMAFHSDAERGLGPRVASLSLGSSAYMHFRVLKKFRDDKSSGASQNVLTLFLRHGDILIMDGAAIQEYYEHTVVPLNFRIAATARYIGAQ